MSIMNETRFLKATRALITLSKKEKTSFRCLISSLFNKHVVNCVISGLIWVIRTVIKARHCYHVITGSSNQSVTAAADTSSKVNGRLRAGDSAPVRF